MEERKFIPGNNCSWISNNLLTFCRFIWLIKIFHTRSQAQNTLNWGDVEFVLIQYSNGISTGISYCTTRCQNLSIHTTIRKIEIWITCWIIYLSIFRFWSRFITCVMGITAINIQCYLFACVKKKYREIQSFSFCIVKFN